MPAPFALAFPAGFEPTTFRLGGGRSILLSYGNILLTLSYCRRPRALCQALPPRALITKQHPFAPLNNGRTAFTFLSCLWKYEEFSSAGTQMPREAEPRLNMRLCYFCIKGPDIAAINRRWLRVLTTEPLLLTKFLILSNKHARCTIT